MKRINKFRGKTPDGKWVYGSLIQDTTDRGRLVTFIVPDLPSDCKAGDLWTAKMFKVDKNSVGQFTGCLDKHGNEVYEGDIVDAWSAGSHCTHGLIRFSCCGFYILLNGDNGPLGPWNLAPSQYTNLDEHLEIVGNVIDNPELVAGYLKWCTERKESWFD
jgi:hypothetical protein